MFPLTYLTLLLLLVTWLHLRTHHTWRTVKEVGLLSEDHLPQSMTQPGAAPVFWCRGVPVERYSSRETAIAYWGIGLYWGRAVSNNKKGHLIGHIKDIGHDPSNPLTRLYATSAAQPYHNDSSDVVTLLCLRNAKEGGLSSWSSSITGGGGGRIRVRVLREVGFRGRQGVVLDFDLVCVRLGDKGAQQLEQQCER